jgi:RimJ/RimL family protein N-acetyltransferase
VQAELIESQRLELRPLLPEHAAEMATVLADPELYAFTGGAPPQPQELRARYERWSAGSPEPAVAWLNWVIWLRVERCLAGTVQATITRPDGCSVAEVAWVVGRHWQGRGIATEAARALVCWLAAKPVAHVVAHIHPDHSASAAVAAAAGLTPTENWQDGERSWELVL